VAFQNYTERIVEAIKAFILDSTEPVQLPALHKYVRQELKMRTSRSTLSRFVKLKLGLRYVKLGVVSASQNTHAIKL
jgi:transposase